jgi:hypothetical protein
MATAKERGQDGIYRGMTRRAVCFRLTVFLELIVLSPFHAPQKKEKRAPRRFLRF